MIGKPLNRQIPAGFFVRTDSPQNVAVIFIQIFIMRIGNFFKSHESLLRTSPDS